MAFVYLQQGYNAIGFVTASATKAVSKLVRCKMAQALWEKNFLCLYLLQVRDREFFW